MLFEYKPLKQKTYCVRCHNYIPSIKLPTDTDFYIDGLPVKNTAEYLESCITYCPKCGLVQVAPVKHLGGIDRIIFTKPDLVYEQVCEFIYNKFGINDYVRYAFLEAHGDERDLFFLENYLNNAHLSDDSINKLSTWQKLEFAEIFRRIGLSELVIILLDTISKDELNNPLYEYVYFAIKNNNQESYKIIIPKELM